MTKQNKKKTKNTKLKKISSFSTQIFMICIIAGLIVGIISGNPLIWGSIGLGVGLIFKGSLGLVK